MGKETVQEYTRTRVLLAAEGDKWNIHDLLAGTLLRIADSQEAMAKDKQNMESRILQLEELRLAMRDKHQFLLNQNAGLRGYITRLKRGRKD